MIKSSNKYYINNRELVLNRAKQRWADKKEEIKAKKLEYRRSISGYLNKTYDNMLGRVRGNTKDSVYYKNLPIMNKEEFLEWALSDFSFHSVYREWSGSGFVRRLCPSIDRIDPNNGYIIGNVRWVSCSENSKEARMRNK